MAAEHAEDRTRLTQPTPVTAVRVWRREAFAHTKVIALQGARKDLVLASYVQGWCSGSC